VLEAVDETLAGGVVFQDRRRFGSPAFRFLGMRLIRLGHDMENRRGWWNREVDGTMGPIAFHGRFSRQRQGRLLYECFLINFQGALDSVPRRQ
jgi:hypothetical protein